MVKVKVVTVAVAVVVAAAVAAVAAVMAVQGGRRWEPRRWQCGGGVWRAWVAAAKIPASQRNERMRNRAWQ